MSTAPASAAHIDWAAVKAKMTTDETRADTDRARDAFSKRLSAADGVRSPAEIDWAAYKKALPELDVDALRADFDKAVATMPPVVYDESADKQAHEAKEASWNAFAAYCASRVQELQKLQAEQSTHKLHKWYRRRQLYSRCVLPLCSAIRPRAMLTHHCLIFPQLPWHVRDAPPQGARPVGR